MTQKVRNNLILTIAFVGLVVAVTLQHRHVQQIEAGLADLSVIGQGKPVLLELGSDQCKPCKAMMPILSELSKEYPGQFTVAFHDVWKDPAPGEKYGIQLIPTQIFLDKDGGELFRHEGFYPKEEILAKWKELGVEIP